MNTPTNTFDKRPPQRPEQRPMTSRQLAELRAAELRGQITNAIDSADEFAIEPGVIPDGWTYEWKRKTVMGQEDPSYQVQLAQMGWEPVPLERHPNMMPAGGNHKTIERKGSILMMRPEMITEEIKAMERRKARDQVRVKEAQLSSAPEGHFDRNSDPRVRPNVKKSYESIPIPE